ncbi:MAG: FKBP-type peptidyl-prolyl cis-trans isomerase [Cyclobacteriaceae bacterium]
MKFKTIFIIVLAVSISFACQNVKNSSAELNTELDSVSYSLGVSIAENIQRQGLDDVNEAAFAQGVKDFLTDEENVKVEPGIANQLLQAYFTNLREKEIEKNIEDSDAFLEENKNKEGVQVTESGLQYKVIEEGTGPSPQDGDQVRVHYTGKTIDGEVFDSSVERGEPAVFGVGQVIPGWTEALKMMNVGGKWELYIPSDLAYGEQGAGDRIGPNAALIFEVELLDIVEDETPQQ